MCEWEILFFSPFNLESASAAPNYLPKVTWENDLTERLRDKQGSRAGYSSPLTHRDIGNLYLLSAQSVCGGGILPTCGLRAVSLLIITISFNYNGCLIKSDSFVQQERRERGR